MLWWMARDLSLSSTDTPFQYATDSQWSSFTGDSRDLLLHVASCLVQLCCLFAGIKVACSISAKSNSSMTNSYRSNCFVVATIIVARFTIVIGLWNLRLDDYFGCGWGLPNHLKLYLHLPSDECRPFSTHLIQGVGSLAAIAWHSNKMVDSSTRLLSLVSYLRRRSIAGRC